MTNELSATEGTVTRHAHMKLCKYNQHSADQLDINVCAVDYLKSKFPKSPQDIPFWRQQIGKFGLTGNSQLCPIGQLRYF